MKIKLILVLVILISFSMYSQEKYEYYKNENINYKILKPENWTVNLNPDDNFILLVGPDLESLLMKKDGAFGIITSVNNEKLSTIESLTNDINEIKGAFAKFELIKKHKIDLNGLEAICIIYEVSNGGFGTTSIQYYFNTKKRTFVIGGSVPSLFFEKYKEKYHKIAQSFTFL